jgi:hypothetical protein
MKKDDQFHQDMQQYIAVTTIGTSTLRKQGASGVIEAAQKYLAVVDLSAFSAGNENDFLAALNAQTEQLRTALPAGAQNWGAARKALNLFLRDICYNRFLGEHHGLAAAEDWMEIPLDGVVARELKRLAGRGKLPQWPGLKKLTAAVSSLSSYLHAKSLLPEASQESILTCDCGLRGEKLTRSRTPSEKVRKRDGVVRKKYLNDSLPFSDPRLTTSFSDLSSVQFRIKCACLSSEGDATMHWVQASAHSVGRR